MARCIDLFAGAGGLSEGLSEAGFHCLFANEVMPVYAQTYMRNHVGAKVLTSDIRTVDACDVLRDLGLKKGELDLIAGGPPCQGFSINAPVRSNEDSRNHLFREYLRFVDAFAPRAVLIENVPGLVSFEKGATLHAIIEALADLGYGADVRILGAAYYGVPQMRWRTIIIGFRGKEVPTDAFPSPLFHAPIRPNFTTTFDGRQLVKLPTSESLAKFTTVEEAMEVVTTDAASAADLRIAVIRMDAIQTDAAVLKDLNKQRENYENKLRDELEKRQKELENEKAEIEKSQDVLSRDALQRRVVDYQNRVNELQRDLTERAQSIEISFQKALNEVQTEHLNPIIEGVIEKKNLSMVIDGRFTRVNPNVENLDITDEVISALDKKVSKVKMDTPQGF